MERRSLPILARQENIWMENQMELRCQQLLVKKSSVKIKKDKTELTAKLANQRERDHKLDWKTSTGLVFGYDKG